MATNRKKVIFFIPILTMGGGERVVSELSLYLPDSIEKVIVLLENKISYPYKGRLICLNIPISNPFLLRIYYFFLALLRFRKVVREERPDYVISFGTPANIINVLSYDKTIVRVDNFLSASSSWIYKILIKLFFNKASKVVCVSKASARDLVDNFRVKKEKIEVIYNPLNIEQIKSLSLEPLEPQHRKIFEKPVVINMGRLSEQKSQRYLIRAFVEVKKTVKEAQLVILGTGDLQPELENMVKELEIVDDVHFLGWQGNPFKFLAESKVFVLSSLWEGLPYVILEAMACRLPIVSADCKSGPREILAPRTDIYQQAKDVEYAEYGVLTPAFDGSKYIAGAPLDKSEIILAQAIIELLTNRIMADSLINKSQIRAGDFDAKNIVQEWGFLWKNKEKD